MIYKECMWAYTRYTFDVDYDIRVLKYILRVSERVKYFSTQQKKILICKRPSNVLEIRNHFNFKILFLLPMRDLLCNHSNSDLFTYEGIVLF